MESNMNNSESEMTAHSSVLVEMVTQILYSKVIQHFFIVIMRTTFIRCTIMLLPL